ncbi:MAG: hypothetical protein PHC35_00125 [Deltaproteobacteria bacterium]|nr:hypothetical protein [Deltaproteobacteria bacterium]
MNLKKLFGCGAALGAAACLFASPSQAYDADFHVYQAGNGVGDALIYPIYAVGGTVKTNLRVVNTSSTYSVVAKVVFREPNTSCESRDFFIYLSPNDEWTADIVDANGTTKIVSTDDSSPEVPLNVGMATTCNGYDASVGYVEVYGVAAMTFTDSNNNTLTGPISKGLIQTAYGTLYNGTSGLSFLSDPMGGHATCVNSGTMQVTYSDKIYGMRYYPSQNVLAGVEEVKDPSMNLVMPMVATALANNCNTQRVSVFEETRWDNYGYNSAVEVRSAIAKSAIHIPYRNDASNSTFAVFNFPVKLSCCLSGGSDCDGVLSSPDACDLSKDYGTSIAQNIYDLQENTTTTTTIYSPAPPGAKIEKEVYIGQLTPPFAEGWVRVKLTDASVQQSGTAYDGTTAVSYAGSAVIPSYLQAAYDLTWVPATFDCSVVTAGGVAVDNCTYQLAPNKK